MLHQSSIFFVLLMIIFVYGFAKEIGDSCKPHVNPNEVSEGVCTPISLCEEAMSELKRKRSHSFLRCGFEQLQEIVCCPRDTISKFGSTERSNVKLQRVADIECDKIIKENIPALNLHILGGEVASVGEFPHMAALGYDRGEGYKFDCGGSIISNQFVLTAAHCIDTLDGIEPTIVRTGVVELGGSSWDPENDVGIDRIILHPDYKRREKYHDLALLRLNKTLSFSSNLNAACLETRDENPTYPLLITGWGQTSNTRNVRSTLLLKATVTYVASERCNESYTEWRKLPQGISSDQLCAGDPQGIKDTCQGDSGGPLQASTKEGVYRIVGVTSFGRGCGSAVPGVYTRLARYVGWLERVVWPR